MKSLITFYGILPFALLLPRIIFIYNVIRSTFRWSLLANSWLAFFYQLPVRVILHYFLLSFSSLINGHCIYIRVHLQTSLLSLWVVNKRRYINCEHYFRRVFILISHTLSHVLLFNHLISFFFTFTGTRVFSKTVQMDYSRNRWAFSITRSCSYFFFFFFFHVRYFSNIFWI